MFGGSQESFSADTDAYPFQCTPHLLNGKVGAKSVALEQKQEGVTIAAQASEVEEKVGISDRNFAVMLGNVLKLTSTQLLQLDQAIQHFKQDVSEGD